MNVLQSFDLILFGGTGDLAMRKLLPALYRRFLAGQFPADARVLGVARAAMTREAYLVQVEEHAREYSEGAFDAAQWSLFAARLFYISADGQQPGSFGTIVEFLKGREAATRIFFLSTAPTLFAGICDQIGSAGIATPQSRVVLEKPLGQDLASAGVINQHVGAVFSEPQIFRIDHYLGKEAVQNLLALRFGNTLFEPLWRRGRIRHVQITVAEDIGVEGRGPFYDQTGALRDMVQNHILQLLCIIAMEPPTSNDADAMRDEKLKVLRALRPLAGRDVLTNTVRGQYRAGAARGKPVPGYLQEQGVPADSTTETFVALKVEIDTWRWAGVPFYLRTGKRLQDKISEIVITFEDVPLSIFGAAAGGQTPNRLTISLQPKDSVTLTILAKSPGEVMLLKPVDLSLDLAESFKTRQLDAYERLLTDVVKGNLTLFMRRDELDAAWRWIDPIRAGWAQFDGKPKGYTAGSWGPAASGSLLGRDGYAWQGEL
ncbi:MAG TPA: glucose-6-phosphate dehydrogenase [Steroidobacteraceae bacterium]|jgi:glucose-6-phosphate 1-dehydrogenase|nr:glucose-6-phosphate dehydrogenase [Steroidobacteraceae bacterium]